MTLDPDARGVLRIERVILMAALGLAACGHAYAVVHRNVNWDEFYFLSFVFDHARGTLATPIQTFHVHIFGWLTSIPGQEVEQIVAARSVYFLLLAATCTCIYRIARRTTSVDGALFAVLCYAAYSNVLAHATSFRADGLSVFLLMTALLFAQRMTHRALALTASAVLVAFALLVTIKSVLFLPVFGLTLLAQPSRDRQQVSALPAVLIFAAILLGATVTLYIWHSRDVVGSTVPNAVTRLQSTASVAFQQIPIRRLREFLTTVKSNPVQWACLAFAIFLLCRRMLTRQRGLEAVSLIGLVIPLVSLLFYRNSFPYFYVFILPPALVLCGMAFDQLSLDRGVRTRRGLLVSLLVTIAILAFATSHVVPHLQDGTAAQRTVIRAIHEIFPQPVPYIDRNGMIASFPKVGFFMSTWGMQRYRERQGPIFVDLLRTRRPHFVIANSPALEAALERKSAGGPLHPDDVAALRTHFVPYWGPVYVAGTQIHLEPATDAVWEVLIAGSYRLQSESSVAIGQVLYPPGSTVTLDSGLVSFRSDVAQDVALIIVSARSVPRYPPPTGPLYVGL
jgi:hypothetical protein